MEVFRDVSFLIYHEDHEKCRTWCKKKRQTLVRLKEYEEVVRQKKNLENKLKFMHQHLENVKDPIVVGLLELLT